MSRRSKNIILCSDGTGNAEGRRTGTNVGRVFKAIDLSENQVAFYDDGVGTEENKYLRALGGAFGWGLKRNIVDLYEFLCRNYQPGDQIYIFGFSRGAYTARAVAGLICACGVIDLEDWPSGRELRKAAERAYDAYRHARYNRLNKTLNRTPVDDFREKYTLNKDVPIRFVGVWDTVDAVGLPIDEAATAFDFLFRFRFSDSKLNQLVKKGCHAVAIDDQRQTFHPDLWEADDTKAKDGNSRIEQVFFAGMHSNVGGGYPKDELSYVPLKWMMAKAEANGLRFVENICEDYEFHANPQGKIYDSRAGLNVFYRFKPRNIHEIAKAKGIENIQIHEAVADRIFGKVENYGPANLRSNFSVIDDYGAISLKHEKNLKKLDTANETHDANGKAYHLEGGEVGKPKPVSRLQFAFTRVADIAWWRQATHIVFVMTVIALASFPWWCGISETQENCSRGWCWLEPLLGTLLMLSGGMAEKWTIALSANPVAFVIFTGIFFGCLILHLFLKPSMIEAGLCAWHVVTDTPPPVIKKNVFHEIAYNVRRSRLAKKIAKITSNFVIPIIFLVAFVLALGWIGRGVFLSGMNYIGAVQHECELRDIKETKNPCINTGAELMKGQTYHLNIADTEDWIDKSIKASIPNGFQSSDGGAVMHFFAPFRRHVDQPWFQLMGKIGQDSKPFPITTLDSKSVAETSGQLILYVNDVYCPLCPDPWMFYENNIGKICAIIREDSSNKSVDTCKQKGELK